MELERLCQAFTVCRVQDYSQVKLEAEFCFTGKTDTERSLVCLTEDVPGNTLAREDGWRAFRVKGTLEFSLVGILSQISGILARAGVGIFAVSTYDTDYILVKAEQTEKAVRALTGGGMTIV